MGSRIPTMLPWRRRMKVGYCEACGIPFESAQGNKYCSRKCWSPQDPEYNAKQQLKSAVTRCINLGIPLQPRLLPTEAAAPPSPEEALRQAAAQFTDLDRLVELLMSLKKEANRARYRQQQGL